MRCSQYFRVILAGWIWVWLACATSVHAASKSADCRACHEQLGLPHAGDTAHTSFDCQDCHRHALSPAFHASKNSASAKPLTAVDTLAIHLNETQVLAVHRQCRSCHETEFKQWTASPHAITFGQSFLNSTHNKVEQPINDCLRCHAMFFEGEVGDLVTPLNQKGPWRMKSSSLAKHPSIPCLSCHQIHAEEPAPAPLPRYAALRPAPEKTSTTTGLYDHREKRFFNLSLLPQPKVSDGSALLKMSTDPRIRNCYQCHSPAATHRAGSSDDRTPRGVHAGLSCLDCHGAHNLSARNSCAQCHPKNSHCNQDVAQMDTTFKNASSPHDIHTVACADCHQGGIPKSVGKP